MDARREVTRIRRPYPYGQRATSAELTGSKSQECRSESRKPGNREGLGYGKVFNNPVTSLTKFGQKALIPNHCIRISPTSTIMVELQCGIQQPRTCVERLCWGTNLFFTLRSPRRASIITRLKADEVPRVSRNVCGFITILVLFTHRTSSHHRIRRMTFDLRYFNSGCSPFLPSNKEISTNRSPSLTRLRGPGAQSRRRAAPLKTWFVISPCGRGARLTESKCHSTSQNAEPIVEGQEWQKNPGPVTAITVQVQMLGSGRHVDQQGQQCRVPARVPINPASIHSVSNNSGPRRVRTAGGNLREPAMPLNGHEAPYSCCKT